MHSPTKVRGALALAAVISFWPVAGEAQTWPRITDPTNPIVDQGAVPGGSYAGASWVDVNGDGWPDLHVSGRPLFVNQAGTGFVADTTALVPQTTPLGNTWADADNDGDLDAFVSGRYAFLYENDGTGQFSRVLTSAVGDSAAQRGFSASFGDYDDDGLVDLLTTHFIGGLAGPSNSNQLLHNDGGLSFSRISGTPLTADSSTYIMPTWTDLDDDQDLDLAIGRGPIGAFGLDRIYENRLVPDGSASFVQINSGILATDSRDGQAFVFVDTDNDQDLDAYVVNYRAGQIFGLENHLYRNDGGGTYVKMTGADVGPIVTNKQISTGAVFEDFDNDGWIDAVVTNDLQKRNKVYRNLGDGSFELVADAPMAADPGNYYAVVCADYDRDGDQDLFISGAPGFAALYRNDNDNGNHWLTVTLEGTQSNRAAIGARVRAKATIGGQAVWQMREVASITGSPGMSDFPVSFGFGDATVVDSLVIEWPANHTQVLTSVAVDQFLDVLEPAGTVSAPAIAGAAFDLDVRPNPFTASTQISLALDRAATVAVDVLDVQGRRVQALASGPRTAGSFELAWNGRDAAGRPAAAGVYFLRVQIDGRETSRKLVRLP